MTNHIQINIKCAKCEDILNEKPKWIGIKAYHKSCLNGA